MAQPGDDVDMETEETSGQRKGKGGHLPKDTSEHFEAKYRAAAMAESTVQLALATENSRHGSGRGDASTESLHGQHGARGTREHHPGHGL